VAATLPESEEELFDAEALSDQPMRALAGEFVREQCFLRLGHELPYEIAVEIDEFDEKDPKCLRVQAVLHVERESQKSIVIGTKGAKVKEIGTEARLRMERFLDRKVFLGIKVKVTPGWSRRESDVERFGYGNVHT
jgi:GTP-binding protein Era